ncbi:NlpC/P60 family protein [Cedecea colo]|uniref:Peptidoglycan endopeptidase n=1 Tax=Cedecea colo TaxID=2552946 RepID=A0ABX0VJM1_9ENTR|nr:NlpC/P60 family protein [Cedecea colo]NIY47259.1 peptidoglycan endopeptidase [Cedecea colo]
MLKSEFIERVTGLPWCNRACSFDGVDCWGLIVLYYRHVPGIELHNVPGYEADNDFVTCFFNEIVYWRKAEAFSDGDMFVAYYGNNPVHVGLVIDGKALHSRGENGHVRADHIRTIQKLYTKVEFYSYAAHRDSACSRPAERPRSCSSGDDIQRMAC